jgi:prevent-host-death family protein
MAKMVNIHAAKTHFSRLVERAADGEEIVIARAGRPVARLMPLATTSKVRGRGMLRGKISVADDFDAPLPKKVLDAFYKSAIEPRRRRHR